MLMLEKEQLSGLWGCPECLSHCCHFHIRSCFTLQFHCVSYSHHFRCDPALSVFASKCQGECHAVKAALCDLGDPGWGDPWFPHWALLLPTPSLLAHGVFVACFVVCLLYGPASAWHTSCHFACTEMILSYHLLLNRPFSPINWYLSRHCLVVCDVFWSVCFCFCVFVSLFVFGSVFGSCFCFLFCLVSRFFAWFSGWTWQCIGLCIGPPPVYFCGHYSNGLCVT